MPDTRPVWITREQRDFCRLWQSGQVNAIADAWDAAPADATEAAAAALAFGSATPEWAERTWGEHAIEVLRALGCPMPKTPPVNAWWCPTCEQVSFDRALFDRDTAHAHGWGTNGISRCPGEWVPITVHLKPRKRSA